MENGESCDSLSSSNANGMALRVQELVHLVQDELRQLLREREDLMQRIGTLKRTMVGLASIFGDSAWTKEVHELVDSQPLRKPGITKKCRSVLMEAGQPMSARAVCDQINRDTPALLAGHRDPIASVTTILNRLVDYGEARRVLLGNHSRGWQWNAALVSEPGMGFEQSRSSPRLNEQSGPTEATEMAG